MSEDFIYDEVPYPSFTFPQTRPDRLSTIGKYFGVETALPDNCRMLELGCGDGTNLLSFAYCHPNSKFVGIDLSKVHIDDANAAKEALRLANARFECGDLTTLSVDDFGQFDFIIAHGLFSWVPDFIRDHVLRIYSECLAPNGIGYISYNAYPGFHIREIARGIMRFHTASIDGVEEKVNQAGTILGFIHEALPKEHLHAKLIERELTEFLERPASNVYHDDLADVNRAYYFHEFASMIGEYGLQYVSESDISSSTTHGFSEEVRSVLNTIGTDLIIREQYTDFIKFRRFRSTLICHSDFTLNRNADPSIVELFRISSSLKPADADSHLSDTSTMQFIGDKDENVQMNHPLTKTVLAELGKVWTRSVDFGDLMERSKLSLANSNVQTTDDDRNKLATFLLRMFHVDLVHFHRFEPRMADAVSDKPASSEFARWQIEHDCVAVTTMTGMNLEPESDLVKLVIELADGSRNKQAIAQGVLAAADVPADQLEEFKEKLPSIVDDCLEKLLRAGLLIA